jgi:hypothetical protein
MTKPVRLRLSRRRGFDLQAHSLEVNGLEAVNVARPTKWGNPFNLRDSSHCWTAISYGFKGDRIGRQAASVAMFKEYLGGAMIGTEDCGLYAEVAGEQKPISVSPTLVAKRPAPIQDEINRELRGKNLACWCKPGEPCHADVLLDIANRPACEEIKL